jgi:DNA repair exonuclease SbcCD ATPase subunit
MMDIAVAFENFLPFRDRQVLQFTNQGFTIVNGVNNISASHDANGVGKSALFSALSAGWYGCDLNGRRGIDLACRHTSGKSEVVITSTDDKGTWQVTRTFRPTHSVVLEGFDLKDKVDLKDLQPMIEARLGFGLLTFRNAWIFGQGNFDRFARADQAAQMRMLDEIQGLDFRVALDRARDWRTQCESQRDACLAQHRDTTGRLGQARSSLADLETAYAQFQESKQRDLVVLDGRIESLRGDLRIAATALKEFQREREKVQKIRGDWDAYVKVAEEHRAHQSILKEAEREVLELDNRWISLSDSLRDLFSHPACPRCKQSIVAGEKIITDAYEVEFALLDAKKKGIGKHLDYCHDRENLLLEIMGTALNILPKGVNERMVAALEAQVSGEAEKRARKTLEDRQNEVRRVLVEREALKDKIWEGAPAMQAAEAIMVAASAEIAALEQQIKKAESALAVAEYWIEAFGDRGMRSLMFDSLAPFLYERIAYHLMHLAGGEVEVPVSATRALKGGGTKERLTFTPTWTWGGQGVEAGSCGQDQRFNIALFAAIQDIAEMRSAKAIPFSVFDEPSMGIDARGRELLLEWIEKESRRRGSGFLITHDSDMAASATPDHVWTVILDASGARVNVQ